MISVCDPRVYNAGDMKAPAEEKLELACTAYGGIQKAQRLGWASLIIMVFWGSEIPGFLFPS